MDTLNARRFRFIALFLLVFALWTGFGSRHAHIPGSWPALLMAGIWVLALFLLRSRLARNLAAAAMFISGAVGAYLDPSLGSMLFVGVGVAGAGIPWRLIRWLAAPIILVTTFVVLGPMHSRITLQLLLSANFLELLFGISLILFFGRIAADNREVREGQAMALAELQTAHAKLQKHAAEIEELAVLRERARLSRELHDTLGHALSAITVQVEAARRLSERDAVRANALLVEVQDAARAAMADLRRHLSALRESSVSTNLPADLRQVALEIATRNGWQLDLDIADAPLDNPACLALVQVAREALTNSERHASARRVALSLLRTDAEVCLSIEDDGCGFDGDPGPGHFGLQGMRERLQGVGGRLTIESGSGRGTHVRAQVPLDASAAAGGG